MKAVNVSHIKKELKTKSDSELVELCLRLAAFKKENKELLTYLLFEKENEQGYVESVKSLLTEELKTINTSSYYYMRKSFRKVLRLAKKFIRYSKSTETEIEILLHYCTLMHEFTPSIRRSTSLTNIFHRQIGIINKKLGTLHEDLQYDYKRELELLI